MEIFHCYQEGFNLKKLYFCTSKCNDRWAKGTCHSLLYNCKSSQGDATMKIIEIDTCLLLLLSCGTVLCFLSFANRKPNMDKLGWLSWDEKSVNNHKKICLEIWGESGSVISYMSSFCSSASHFSSPLPLFFFLFCFVLLKESIYPLRNFIEK